MSRKQILKHRVTRKALQTEVDAISEDWRHKEHVAILRMLQASHSLMNDQIKWLMAINTQLCMMNEVLRATAGLEDPLDQLNEADMTWRN